MSAEDRRERNEDERRELRKLAYEDANRTFAEVDPDARTAKIPIDPPRFQWKDLPRDLEPKASKDGFVDPKQPWFDPKAPWMDPKLPVFDPKQPWFDPKQPWFDPKAPWMDPKPIRDPEPKGVLDPKSVFQDPKNVLDPKQIQDPKGVMDPKSVFHDPKSVFHDPKLPKGDIDPDPKGIFDPKNIYDPPKLAYDPGPFDPGRVFDPGRFGFDPGAVARRPFVLGMPHHAPGAGMMAGADPRAAAMMRSGAGYAGGEAPDPAVALEATLSQVESTMRTLKADLERLDDYYRELREQYDELQAPSDDDTGGDQPAEDDDE